MKKRQIIFIFMPLLLILLFLGNELRVVFQSHFTRLDYLNLKEKSSSRFTENDFLKDTDHRENSLYFLFSRPLDNEEYILIPRFRVQNSKILSVLEATTLTHLAVRLEKINTIPFSKIVADEQNYSFSRKYSLFTNQMTEEKWANALSFLFESNTDILIKRYASKLWFLKELRQQFHIGGQQFYDIFQLGNRSFCITYSDNSNEIIFFSLGDKEVSIYQMSGEIISMKKFMMTFLSKAQWIDQNIEIPFPESKQNFTVFTILDFFTFTKLLDQHRNMIEEFTVDYFRRLLSNKEISTSVKDAILSSLQEIKVISSLKDNQGKAFYSEAFKLDVEQLLHTLREF